MTTQNDFFIWYNQQYKINVIHPFDGSLALYKSQTPPLFIRLFLCFAHPPLLVSSTNNFTIFSFPLPLCPQKHISLLCHVQFSFPSGLYLKVYCFPFSCWHRYVLCLWVCQASACHLKCGNWESNLSTKIVHIWLHKTLPWQQCKVKDK